MEAIFLNTYQERRKDSMDKRKRQIVQNWFSSFVVTTIVVAIIILAPPKVSATFLRIEPFGSNLFYQVQVIDEGKTILEGSLKIKVDHPLGQFEAELPLGISSGSFDGLRPGTAYQVSIVAKRGFGEEVLIKETVVTESSYGGRIVSTSYETIDTGSMHESLYRYTIYTSISDRLNEIEEVWFEYAYLFEYIEGVTTEPTIDEVEIYPITTYQQATIIDEVPGFNGVLYLRMKALLVSQEIVVLDQQIIKTPIHIESYLYVDDVGPTMIQASTYLDFEVVTDIRYYVRLVRNGTIIEEKEIKQNSAFDHYDSYVVSFDRLMMQSYYHVILVASYIDPVSLKVVTNELANERVSTSSHYQLTISHTKLTSEYQVQIELSDSTSIIQNMRYIIYDTSDEFEYYYDSASIVLDSLGNGLYQGTIMISIPQLQHHRIQIFVDKQVLPDQIYYYVPVYEIVQ